jgi:hypothetical protein
VYEFEVLLKMPTTLHFEVVLIHQINGHKRFAAAVAYKPICIFEINQPDGKQPFLAHAVEIANSLLRLFGFY